MSATGWFAAAGQIVGTPHEWSMNYEMEGGYYAAAFRSAWDANPPTSDDDPRARALEAVRNRNIGPKPKPSAPRRLDPTV